MTHWTRIPRARCFCKLAPVLPHLQADQLTFGGRARSAGPVPPPQEERPSLVERQPPAVNRARDTLWDRRRSLRHLDLEPLGLRRRRSAGPPPAWPGIGCRTPQAMDLTIPVSLSASEAKAGFIDPVGTKALKMSGAPGARTLLRSLNWCLAIFVLPPQSFALHHNSCLSLIAGRSEVFHWYQASSEQPSNRDGTDRHGILHSSAPQIGKLRSLHGVPDREHEVSV
jgi:hypothetical protein